VHPVGHLPELYEEARSEKYKIYVCTVQGSPAKSKHKHTVTLSVAAWHSRRLCYRPAVLFRHFRLTMLLFLQEKNRRALQKIFLFFFKYISKFAQVWSWVTWNCVRHGVSVTAFKNIYGKTPENMYLKVRRNLRPTVPYNLHHSTFALKYSYGMCAMRYCEYWQMKQYSIQVCEYKSLSQYSNKKAGGILSCIGRDKIIMMQCCKTFRLKTTTACVLQTGNIFA